MMHHHMMMGCGYDMYYANVLLLFTMKIILVLMLFTCLLVIMVREREIIKILKEIRDKK